MPNRIYKLVFSIALAFFIAGPLAAQDNTETLGLEMDVALGKQSLEKIADGSASVGQSRLKPESTPSTTSFPFLLAALALGLTGFAVGVFITRRNATKSDSKAPVALWLDAEKLQAELQDLENELKNQQHSNDQLSSDREQLLLLHADQLHELRGEKEEMERELHALRLRGDDSDGDAHTLIDELRIEIEQLRGADEVTPDRRDLPAKEADQQELRAELDRQQAQISELEDLLRGAQDENQSLEQSSTGNAAKLETLESTLAIRDDELEMARHELENLREKAELLDEKESRVANLDDELTTLRDEMNQLLGKTGQYKVIIPELESKLFHRQEQIGALESDLEATTHEVIERDRNAKLWEGQVKHLQQSLEAAEIRNNCLEADLESALEKNELLSVDPDTEELHQENLTLRRNLREVEERLQEATTKLDGLQLHSERVEHWNSTVTSLQAEIRRKSTLIDSQADHLDNSERQMGLLKAELDNVRQQLVARNEESQSLRELLEQAGDVVVSLRDEIGEEEHAATRIRLAQDPRQDPFGHHEEAVEEIEADIEALRFTVRSRRDLGDSLETILEEERVALEQASRRVTARDEDVIGLRNELSANRVAMVALQSRLSDLANDGENGSIQSGMEPARVERELQQSMRVLEALRADLHKWRGRVKPLHEALVSRNERIHALESEVAALRHAQGLDPVPQEDELVDDVAELLNRAQNGEEPEQERTRTLDEMKTQWDRIVSLETDLAETGAKLARVLELDDARCRQIESLELARTAQLARLAELRTELSVHGIDPEISPTDHGENVVDLGARRPS